MTPGAGSSIFGAGDRNMPVCESEWCAREHDRRIAEADAMGIVECGACRQERVGAAVCARCNEDVCEVCEARGVTLCAGCAEALACEVYAAGDAAWDQADALEAEREALVAAGFSGDAVAVVDDSIATLRARASALWAESVSVVNV